MSDRRDYEVGYGRPPKATRFQKGVSGNPQGRPKGSLNVATLLDRELNQRVTIKEHGQARSITKLEAAIKQLVNKAATGDGKTIQLLMTLLSFSEDAALKAAPRPGSSANDQALLESIRRRMLGTVDKASPEPAV